VFIPKFTNIVSKDAPSTISGVAIGKNIKRFVVERPLNLYLPNANAISVPSTVEIVVAVRPIIKEFPRALHTSGAPQGFFHLSSVKPFQIKFVFLESLKENTKVYRTGIKR
jgi:hypothetical protein